MVSWIWLQKLKEAEMSSLRQMNKNKPKKNQNSKDKKKKKGNNPLVNFAKNVTKKGGRFFKWNTRYVR